MCKYSLHRLFHCKVRVGLVRGLNTKQYYQNTKCFKQVDLPVVYRIQTLNSGQHETPNNMCILHEDLFDHCSNIFHFLFKGQ